MFGRKRRVAANPAFGNGSQATPSAQTAAALAFLNPRASSASLSAAAAATALRNRPMSPTSVADVQTKRTMRRTNSNSSMGSSVSGSTRGPPGSQLQRRGSSGSMTERTFRDPSPNRGSARPSLDDAPPVPTIPKNLPPALPKKSHRRASSMETTVIPRIASPLPNPATGRGSSLEPYRGNQTPRRPAQRITSLSSVQELTGTERPDSRGSVNFSYPTGLRGTPQYGQRRLTSPTPSSASQRSALVQKQNLVYDPNTRTFIPETELLFIEQSIQDAAERPVRRKKKVAPQGATGTHLSDGTVGGRIQGTSVNASSALNKKSDITDESQASSQPTYTTAPTKKKRPSASETRYGVESPTPSMSDYDSDNSERPMKMNTRAGMLLVKKPSVVREDREREEAEDDTSKISDRQATLKKLESKNSDARPASPIASSQPKVAKGRGSAIASTAIAQNSHQPRSVSQSIPTFSTETTATSTLMPTTLDKLEAVTGGTKSARVQSLSPARNAHFLTTPESLAVRHQPPARSISPRKSALKHSPSRGSSPNGEVLARSATNRGSSRSETSDMATPITEEQNLPKKKAVRVSFDDSSVVLGHADTPVTSDTPVLQSPQGKRGWFSGMGKGRKKDMSDMDDDDDEIMKPRPALPSFGSVREKKFRDTEERPLVKPTELSEPVAQLPSPLFTTATGESIEYPLGQSNDHAIGSAIAHDQASKNAANISKSREPLPPEVTSVEGSGYLSDSGSSVGTTEHIVESSKSTITEPDIHQADTKSAIDQVPKVEEKSGDIHSGISDTAPPVASIPIHEAPEVPPTKSNGKAAIPSLALTRASPRPEDTHSDGQWPYIIGGFPASSDSGLDDSQSSFVEEGPTELSPSAIGIAEPEPTLHPSGFSTVGNITPTKFSHRRSLADEDTEDSDDHSVYSDAAEDLCDMQGDGFLSLDAVVESPIAPNIPGLAIRTPPESPTTRNFKDKSYVKSDLSKGPREPEEDEGWEKAQEYWSGLTTEKKKQLERAAREESDESTDDTAKPAPKPKTEKKVVVKSPPANPQVNQPSVDYFPDRTYQILPGAKAAPHGPVPAMRSSMRGAQSRSDEITHMRTSMRTPPPSAYEFGQKRRSMRDSGTFRDPMRGTAESTAPPSQVKGSLQKKYRAMSIPQTEIKPSPVEVKKYAKSPSTNSIPADVATKPTPTLRRKGSADSDSSFKRARPATEGYNMKRSMRGPQPPPQSYARPQSPEQTASTVRSGRFSLRSLSPTGSAFRDSPSVGLGRTLRHNRGLSADSAGPTLRSPAPDKTKSASRFSGFGKSKPAPKPKAARMTASRFADSSDEEDAQPAFRSRFVDSDDEDDAAPVSLAKTRHANIVADDSSDLSDLDDEKPSKHPKATKAVVPPPKTATSTHIGSALASRSLRRSGSGRDFIGATTTTVSAGPAARPNQKRRGSFMSSILRRKKADPASKVQKIDGESGARRDTPLERTRADLRAVRQDSYLSTASGASSPKLQKRSAMRRTGTLGTLENWPLASPHLDTNDDPFDERPHTSGGVDLSEKILENGTGPAVPAKPDLGPRRTTATGLAAVDLNNVLPLKKKKKFGMLRRAFRLDD